MASSWKRLSLTLPGPDTDALRAEFRDGMHFNARGLRRHGERWADQVHSQLPTAGTRH